MSIKCYIPVSIIIPCFNCSLTVERALLSVYNQSVLPTEVILVDDCSTDDTYNKLCLFRNKYHELQIFRLTINQGAASARNFGWKNSSQPFISFLDADDSWHPDKLSIQYNYMKNNDNVTMSGHTCVHLKDSDIINKLSIDFSVKSINRFSLLIKNPFNTPSVMIKRDIPFRFKKGKRYAEDFLLWQEIIFNDLKIVRIELPLAYVHKPLYGTSGLSKDLWNMEKGELDNFIYLYNAKKINFISFMFAILLSLLKYFKRVLISFIKSKIQKYKYYGYS